MRRVGRVTACWRRRLRRNRLPGGAPRPADARHAQRRLRPRAGWRSPTRASRPSSSAPGEQPRFFDDIGCLARLPRASSSAAGRRRRVRRRPPHEGLDPRRPRRLHARAGPRDADGLAPDRPRRRRVARRGPGRARRRAPSPPREVFGAAGPAERPEATDERPLAPALRPAGAAARGALALDPDLRGGLRRLSLRGRRLGLRPFRRPRRPGLRPHRRLARPARAAARPADRARDRSPGALAGSRRGGAPLLPAGRAADDPARASCSASSRPSPRRRRSASARPGLVVFSQSGGEGVSGFLLLVLASLVLTAVFLGIAAPCSRRVRWAAAARGPWRSRSSSGSPRSSSSTSRPSAWRRSCPRAPPRAS